MFPKAIPGFQTSLLRENLALATAVRGRGDLMTMDAILDLFPRLGELLSRRGAALSGGERQLLSIARAVIRSPRLLLLDEMTEGVQPSIVEEIAERLRNLHDQIGMSILIVDQELAFVAFLATRVLVLQNGQVVKELAADELSDPEILGGFGGA